MQYQIKKNTVIGIAVFAVAMLALTLGAFPGSANAQTYGYYGSSGYSSCPNPTVWANGYYKCNYQTTSYNYPPSYPTYPQYPTYPTYPTYQQLSVSCYANNSSVPVGSNVTWVASATGGNGQYTYSWSGTDSLSSYGQSVAMTYYTAGSKYANVTVYSAGGQTASATCSNTVNVYAYNYYPQSYNYSNYNYNAYPSYAQTTYVQPAPIINQINTNASGLDIGCYADPISATVNQPVTWNAEVTGGMAPYRITWSGTDGLSGDANSLIKYYQSSGAKSAVVTVTSADGRTGTRACSNVVTVRAVSTGGTVQPTPAPQPNNSNGLGAAALFSLGGVPWGWVAILVILVLFATVMYLLFNKPKI